MSKYVSKMKGILNSFNATVLEIHKKMDANSQYFNPDYAAEQNNKLRIQVNQAVAKARDQIDSIHKEAEAAARKWAEPSGENIDSTDLSLLKGDFDLSGEDLHVLLVKHQDNSIMVNAIAKYAKAHNVVLDYVPNLADKLFAYESFAKSAHNVISDIAGNISLSAGYLALAKWAEPGNISQRMEIVLYGIKAHDIVSPEQPKGKFNFNFAPLNGR